MNAPKPPEHPTTQLAKPDRMEILIQEMRVEMRNRFDTHSDLLIDFGDRLGRVEERVQRHSTRANEPSQHDLDAKAALAKEIVARQELAEKVDKQAVMLTENTADTAEIKTAVVEIKKAVVGVITNKKVIFIGRVLFAIAMTYAAAKGILK